MFNLDAPEDILAFDVNTWTVAPHQSKTIVDLVFMSKAVGKFNGFINIKTNHFKMMIIHVDIAVVNSASLLDCVLCDAYELDGRTTGGVHLSPMRLDFGTLTYASEKRSMNLFMVRTLSCPYVCTCNSALLVQLNAGRTPVVVSDIFPASPNALLQVGHISGCTLTFAERRNLLVIHTS